jgi:PRTRC genetic system protein B
MELSRALLLYTAPAHQMATIHTIWVDDGVPTILPGECLTREGLEEILHSLSKAPMQRAILPPEVICDTGCLCWWKPATRTPIFFNTKEKKFNQEVSGKMVLHPPLLFLAKPGRLQIFALQDDARPSAETILCRAPYYNLYDEGAMCRGNVRLPEVCQVRDIPIWEKAFFETNFTHSNIGGQKLTNHKDGHDGLWRQMAGTIKTWCSGKEVFPGELLIPLKITLQEAVNK